jgi:hypothetical protein
MTKGRAALPEGEVIEEKPLFQKANNSSPLV